MAEHYDRGATTRPEAVTTDAVTNAVERWLRDETATRYGMGLWAPVWTGVAFLADHAELGAMRFELATRLPLCFTSWNLVQHERRRVFLVVASEARVWDCLGVSDWWTTCLHAIPSGVLVELQERNALFEVVSS